MWRLGLALLGATAGAEEQRDWALSHPFADDPADYFAGPNGGLLRGELGGAAAEAALDYDVTEQSAYLVVPDAPPPPGGYGVFVFVSADASGAPRSDWAPALHDRSMIYVGAHEVGNTQDSVLRIAWTLDALASVQAAYDIDPARTVVGGFSGGGAVATMVGAHYAEHFVGTVDMCRAVMWEPHEISTIEGSSFGLGEVDHLDPDGLDALGTHRFAFISGDRDLLPVGPDVFSNYEGLLDGLGDWWARGLRARLWDVPGLQHQKAPSYVLGLALDWVVTCADSGEHPARFDSDHAPPHTPVSTPSVAPPEACDPVEGSEPPAVAGGGDEASGGCGCGVGPQTSPPWGVAWAAALARRRERRWRSARRPTSARARPSS